MRTGVGRGGFSALEALIAMLILAACGQIAWSMMSHATATFAREARNAGLQTELPSAQSTLLEEAMIAGFSPDGVAASLGTFREVTTGTSADRVAFIADVDSDGVSDLVTYDVADGTLRRTVQRRASGAWQSGTAQPILGDVEGFTLTFLTATRTALTSAQVLAGGTRTARHLRATLRVAATARGQRIGKTFVGEIAFRNRNDRRHR